MYYSGAVTIVCSGLHMMWLLRHVYFPLSNLRWELAFFRYTLAITISATLAPLVALAMALHKYMGLAYIVIAGKLVALVVWISWVRGRKDKNLAKTFPAYPGGEKKVAVVGGGCAGIVACKEMLDEGHTVSNSVSGRRGFTRY